MANYHLNASTGSRGGGQSAKAKASYIQREGRYARDSAEVLHTKSSNMPGWAADAPTGYWDAADLYERVNGRLFKEVEFSLPIELTLPQQRELVSEFARHLTRGECLPYTLAIHAGGGSNPHCHLMISERKNDGIERPREQWFKRYNGKKPDIGGAQKSEKLKPKNWLEQTRADWSDYANRALDRAGYDDRIDHRTLEAQGIDRLPTIHLGPNVVELEAKGIQTDRGDKALSIEKVNAEIIDLQEHLEAIEHERNRQSTGGQEHQRVRGADRTAGPEFGSPSRRSNDPNNRNEEGQPGAGDNLDNRTNESHGFLEAGSRRDENGGRRSNGSQPERPERGERVALEVVGGNSDSFSDAYSSAADRIVALAGTASNDPGGRNVAAVPTKLKGDRTTQAIARQTKAMGCERYDIGIREPATGQMMNREWSHQELLKNVAWLKRMNAQGNDIYIRPAADVAHGLVLVDDLAEHEIDDMKAAGHEPALVVETSPKNYQAWVKVADNAPDDHRGVIARDLVQMYDADAGSADSRHYGRLAGFTNQKDEHTTRAGYQPWVLCRESSGVAATAGPQLMQQASQTLDSIEQAKEKAHRLDTIASSPDRWYHKSAVDEYRSEMKGLVKQFDDLSRCDFIAAMKLASNGRDVNEIAQAMAEASPALADRKAGHEADYIERTIKNVMELPQVQAARAILAANDHEPGLGM